VQPAKALTPMSERPAGIVMPVSRVQFSNALVPISVTPAGMAKAAVLLTRYCFRTVFSLL